MSQDVVKRRGVEYVEKETRKTMCEFHVDDDNNIHTLENERYDFGGTTSHLKSPKSKPLIIFGQYEVIFNQFCMKNSQWVGPNGERALLPKNSGCGIMIPAFQCRELGFGLDLSEEELKGVNKMRKGKK